MTARLIFKGSSQIAPDDWGIYHKTFDVVIPDELAKDIRSRCWFHACAVEIIDNEGA